MVCGNWVNNFIDASHVCFEGNLNNPFFSAMATQKIKCHGVKTIEAEKSGVLMVKNWKGRQRVRASYDCPITGKRYAWGYPFKDDNTKSIYETILDSIGGANVNT